MTLQSCRRRAGVGTRTRTISRPAVFKTAEAAHYSTPASLRHARPDMQQRASHAVHDNVAMPAEVSKPRDLPGASGGDEQGVAVNPEGLHGRDVHLVGG